MSRICLIINPAARSAGASRSLTRLRHLAREAAVAVKLTAGPGDAEAQAERAVAQGYDTVVAAGGDGTINEIVNGLDGAPVRLGIVPVGTMNVFAFDLGIPMNLDRAWEVVLQGKARRIDLASANDHWFVQLAGVGLDAQIVERTDRGSKLRLGPLSYLLTATQVVGQRPPRLRVHSDHGTAEGSFVLVGNGRFYGGPFMLFTEAASDDGLLDVCVFKYMNYLHLMRYLRGILFGSHTRFSDVRYFKTSRLRVDSEETVPVEADGELIGHLPCEFSIHRRKLQVLVP